MGYDLKMWSPLTSSKFPKPAGYHIAMNPLTGKVAWKTPLQDLGRGGSNPTRAVGDMVPAGGSVWTFALLRD